MTEPENEAVVRQYLAAFNDRDRERLQSLLAEDAVEHGVHEDIRGADAIADYLEGHFEAFPDYTGETAAIAVDDDLVAVRYSASGTHTGRYRGVEPTGHRATWTGISMYRIVDGQINEVWVEEDRLGLLEQLELVDASDPAHLRL
ncbi:MAG: ester cyclase [Halobacteriales archaeon]